MPAPEVITSVRYPDLAPGVANLLIVQRRIVRFYPQTEHLRREAAHRRKYGKGQRKRRRGRVER
jgi:hypothetical protein